MSSMQSVIPVGFKVDVFAGLAFAVGRKSVRCDGQICIT